MGELERIHGSRASFRRFLGVVETGSDYYLRADLQFEDGERRDYGFRITFKEAERYKNLHQEDSEKAKEFLLALQVKLSIDLIGNFPDRKNGYVAFGKDLDFEGGLELLGKDGEEVEETEEKTINRMRLINLLRRMT